MHRLQDPDHLRRRIAPIEVVDIEDDPVHPRERRIRLFITGVMSVESFSKSRWIIAIRPRYLS